MDGDSLYSDLEEFLETAQRTGADEATSELFGKTKNELENISSPLKAPKAQRALLAISRVEELINELLLVGDELAAQTANHKVSKR